MLHRRAVLRALFAGMALVVVTVLARTGLPPCPLAAALYVSGLALIAAVLAAAGLLDVLCQPHLEAGGDELVVRLGRCGSVRIPLALVEHVDVVDRVYPVLRLGGTAVPGLLYTGYYMIRGGSRAYIYSERLSNLLRLRLINGTEVYIGGNAVRLFDTIPRGQRRGNSETAAKQHALLETTTHPGLRTIVSASIIVALVAGLLLYPLLPSHVPSSYGSSWKPKEYMTRERLVTVYYGAAAPVILILGLIYRYASRRDPVTAPLIALTATGLTLLLVSTMLVLPSHLCTH